MAVPRRQRPLVVCVAVALLLGFAAAADDRHEQAPPSGEEPADPIDVAARGELPQQAAVTAADDLEYDPFFDEEIEAVEVFDPLESSNRAIYRFNRGVSTWVFDPLTSGYRFVVPGVARRAVLRAFHNLNAPIFVVNHLLQLRPIAALETLGAFAMNLSFGVGGLFETASGARLELLPADFGQTLAGIGVTTGPYIIMPLLGPTTLRDGLGFVVDRAFHPLTYLLAAPVQLIGYGGIGVARRDEVHDALSALEDSSLDSYAVIRSAYAQAREGEIEEMGEGEIEEMGEGEIEEVPEGELEEARVREDAAPTPEGPL